MALVLTTSDKKKWFYGVLKKILTLKRHFRSTWPVWPGFRKMLQLDISYYHTKYHCNRTWRFEDIRSQNYNELYRKKISRHYDVISGQIDTKLNDVTVKQIWRTGSCLSLRIHIKNSPWFFLSKALIFIQIGSLVAKIWLYRQFRVLCVYFRNRKCYRPNSKNAESYSQVIHPVQISAL